MEVNNHSTVTEIFLLGFQHLSNFKILVFIVILLIHILTVYENALVITLVTVSRGLQSPMFFFLRQLSFSDLLLSVVIVPTLLRTVINEGAKMSLIGCFKQFYLFGATEALQCLLLSVMSYDRYLAICNPLRYSSIMNHRLDTVNFDFCSCNQNTINHFFCDYFPLLELSCSDTSLAQILALTVAVPVILFPFLLIVGSYICIAHEILKIVSSIGKQKAFSTCSSHLAVVSIFYGTLIVTYVVPTRNQSQTISKHLSLLYTVTTPFINPTIYSLKSADMKNALQNIIKNILPNER
ncbi:hypothetical protein XENTR_v10010341 [Xenopus tropicalis]|nr:hypothetical protein XENTR_v10010341 [Xenopus tropicalis]